MSRRIPVSRPQAPLQNPFASLSSEGLPTAPEPQKNIPEPEAKKRFRVVLRREKSGRGGKTVLVVSQLPTHLSPPELENLCREARRSLGCGGSVRGRELELQGDQPARLRAWLEAGGYSVVGP